MKAWLVNTNSKISNGNPNGYEYMLRQNKAAAYYEQAHKVDKINKDDLVLLYNNDNNVVGVGAVVKKPTEHDFSDLNIEHWADVNWLWKADFDGNKPINPINRNDLGITMVNNTVVNVTKQLKYEELFKEICKKQKYL